MDSPITEVLAGFVAGTSFDDLPHDVVHETKRILLDVLGCALSGGALDKGRLAVDFVRGQGGPGEVAIMGLRDRAPTALAVFANAELMHAPDHCPLLPPGHVTPFVTAPVLALAEAKGVSGKEVVTALALAHETASRVGLSLDGMRSATGGITRNWGLGFNAFGAAAGAAKSLGLSGAAMADALGLAGYFAPVASHNKFLTTPEGAGLAKYGPAGWIAQGGLNAAMLASIGYHGDRSVLDGEYGFGAMTGSARFDAGSIVVDLGNRWNLLRVMYKRWPCAGNFQSPLDAFERVVSANALAASEIEAIDAKVEAFALLPRFQFGELRHNVDTQTNLAYNLAAIAHGLSTSSDWQSQRTRDDPSIRALMAKVSIEAYPKAEEARHQELMVEKRSYIERRPSLVTVRARGQEFVGESEYASWLAVDNRSYRATDDDLVRKFRTNAGGVLPPVKLERIIDRVMTLETCERFADLLPDLVP